MEFLGQIGERKIYYCDIRTEQNWFDGINFSNWIAFTIVDEADKHLLNDLVSQCIDKGVCYICSSGQLASVTEDYFDEEIVWREVQKESKTGVPQDYEKTPMTSFHRNFEEGFWFATTLASQQINEEYVLSSQVICIDCTVQKVRRHLKKLIEKINSGWLPNDNEIREPRYDNL